MELLLHPFDDTTTINEIERWRDTYNGGREFVNKYLKRLSRRESDDDFADRKLIAYIPEFANSAIEDIVNAIFQRIADVRREGGAKSYQQTIEGQSGGVDLNSSSMNIFMGEQIIPELCVMEYVGVLIDNFDDIDGTMAENEGKRPFISTYRREEIISWAPANPVNGFKSVLLKECLYEYNEYGLPSGKKERFRLMQRVVGGVQVSFFDKMDTQPTNTFFLKLEKIPFVLFKIRRSLMKTVCDYQIALLNIESSDISYIRKSNIPFYYEFYDPKYDPIHQKTPAIPTGEGISSEAVSKDKEVKVGSTQGRRFPLTVPQPGFIAPPAETLTASMAKQEQLKKDIRALVHLNLSSLDPRRQSADSKAADDRSLEAGLSAIALELQRGEQQIAEYWQMFEQESGEIKILYPKTYDLQSESEKRKEAEELSELIDSVQSDTAKRELQKVIAWRLLGNKVRDSVLISIYKEIDNADVGIVKPEIIISAHESGLIQDVTASTALGFNGEKEIPMARKDRAERIKLTLEAQGGPENANSNRGAPEFGEGSDEKLGKEKRGEEDKNNLGQR